MKVHPVADLFPMLSDDELSELAEDIKANGQVHPIVTATIDGEETLIDGRNRLAACELAGIEPRFTSLNGHDPVSFILSTNVQRRHLTKSQTAMAVARAQLFLGNKGQQEVADATDVSQTSLAKAVIVLRFAPELADAVMAGTMPLNDAYEKARKRKQAKEQQEKADQEDAEAATAEAEQRAVRLAAMRKRYSDLYEQVTEERLSLGEAESIADTRDRDRESRIKNAKWTLNQILTLMWRSGNFDELAAELIESADPPNVGAARPWTRANADAIARFAAALAKATPY